MRLRLDRARRHRGDAAPRASQRVLPAASRADPGQRGGDDGSAVVGNGRDSVGQLQPLAYRDRIADHVWSKRHTPYLFTLVVVPLGLVLFCLLFVDLKHFTISAQFAATAIGFRLGLGAVHFLYDRWVWSSAIRRCAQRLVGIY